MPGPDPRAADRRRRRRRAAASVVAAVLLLLAPFLVVDAGAVLDALRGLSPARLAGLVALVALAMGLWGTGLALVLSALDRRPPLRRAVPLFVATTFANNVTPLGEAGGNPVAGALVAGSEGVVYEVGLAGITALNALNRVAAVALGVCGAAVLLSRGVAGGGLRRAVAVVAVAALLLAALVVVGWRARRRLVAAVGPPLDRAGRWLARRVPLVPVPAEESLAGRVAGFVDAVERLVAAPGTLGAVLVLGVAGHVAVAAALWAAAAGVGVDADPTTVLVIVPVAKVSGLSPTPGGAGSAVVVLAGLLVATTAAGPAEATAAALTYRAAAFWLPTAVGGLVAATVVGRWSVRKP